MGVIASSMSLCLGNQHCLQWAQKLMMSSVTETASTTLGLISVFVWMVAEIPQIITNYRGKSAEGLSGAFLMTWIIGDLFNLFGCLLEPATLPTQLYTAVLYTIITLALCSQAIYYGHIYPQLKYNRQLKGQIDTPTNTGQSKSGMETANDADQREGIGLSSPIPLPALTQNKYVGRQLYYQSARYLSKGHTPTADSILAQRLTSSSHVLTIEEEEPLLSSAVLTQSAPALKIKSTLCVVSLLTFLGVFNLIQSPDTRTHSVVSKPRQEFVIYVGRKLFQVSGHQLPEHGVEGHTGIGTSLGWAMAFIYMSGRLPQIYLNIRRGNTEVRAPTITAMIIHVFILICYLPSEHFEIGGVSPLMFLFALVGNATYVASILVRSLDWSRIGPNLPWLVESGGCTLLDSFIVMQFLYFRYWTSKGLESGE